MIIIHCMVKLTIIPSFTVQDNSLLLLVVDIETIAKPIILYVMKINTLYLYKYIDNNTLKIYVRLWLLHVCYSIILYIAIACYYNFCCFIPNNNNN